MLDPEPAGAPGAERGILRNQGEGLIVSGAGGCPLQALWGRTVLYNRLHCSTRTTASGSRVEDLAVQELVPQLAVEALVVSVLPRTTGLYVERLHTEPGEPPPHELCADDLKHERKVALKVLKPELAAAARPLPILN